MNKKIKEEISDKKNVVLLFMIFAFIIADLILLLKVYVIHIDNVANKIMNSTDVDFIQKEKQLNKYGLYELNISEELNKFIIDKNIESISYKVDQEKFYFDILITRENNSIQYEIERIVDEEHGINAKMKMENVKEIEYRTGNSNNATLLKITTEYDTEYLVIVDDSYYFLGADIESISFSNNHFYYVTYNSNYSVLDEATSCDKKTKEMVDGFNYDDYYYKYGKINFFEDFYQKLSSKEYTVKDRCEELENNIETEEN